VIQGIHVVKKARRDGPPIWYVYAYRGGPQIHRHEGWQRPKLKPADVSKWIAAAEARCEKVTASPVTLNDLIDLWRPSSPDWKALAPSTQRTWGSALKAIEKKWGATPLSVWSDPRMASKVIDWRDSRSNTPRTADFGVVVLRALLKFGRLRGKVAINVAEGIPSLYRNGSRAEIIWTDQDLTAFAQASVKLELAHVNDGLRLAALTGLRRDDLVTLTWDEVNPHAIIKKAGKISRGKRRTVVIPRFAALDALLDELRTRQRKDGVNTVLVNSFGQSWSGDGFGGSFIRVRDAANIVHTDPETKQVRKKHLHDVRGTFCTKLITQAKLTNQEAAEIMGWSPEQVAGIRRTYVDQGAVNMAIAARLRDSL
jgi:integrase